MATKPKSPSQHDLTGLGTTTASGKLGLSHTSGKFVTHRDQIHGDTVLDPLTVELLNTPALQRLGRIYQLGYAHLVFRGGTHTRLSHVIGAFHMATKLVDALKQNYVYRSNSPLSGVETPDSFLPFPEKVNCVNERWQFLRYTTAWAALLHDIGHIPMGHTLEDEFDNIYTGHDKFESERIPYLWHETETGQNSEIYTILHNSKLYPEAFNKLGVKPKQVWQTVILICLYKEKRQPNDNRTFRDLLVEATEKAGKEETYTFATTLKKQLDEAENITFFPYMADIVGNTICADYLDYLRRDPYSVGLDVLWDDRVISNFYVAREGANEQLRMALALVDRNGKRRLDTCTGVLELVRQRFRFAEVIYYHKSKVSASAMFAKALSLIGKPSETRTKRQKVISISDISSLAKGLLSGGKGTTQYDELKASCFPRSMMDPEIGDDSLHVIMQHNAWENIKQAQTSKDKTIIEKNLAGLALLQAITRRQLYKTRMTVDSKAYANLSPGPDENTDIERRIQETLAQLRGKHFQRDKVEKEMAESAGWPNHSVLLYVPPRKSQAKGIDTFALQLDGVVTLGKHEAVQEKIKELSNDYKNLWRIVLLVSPERSGDALGLSKAVESMLRHLWPTIDLRDEAIINTIRGACWFPYIKQQEYTAAEMYKKYMERVVQEPNWEQFIRIRHYAVDEGTLSTEEHAYRAYVAHMLGANIQSEIKLRNNFPKAGNIIKYIDDNKQVTVSAREGNVDEIEVCRLVLDKIVEDLTN